MKLIFFIFLVYYYTDLLSSDNCGQIRNKICKPHMLNGHYIKWPNEKVERIYKNYRKYKPKNLIFTRFQICGQHVYLVSPRYKEGVPFTLGIVTLNGNDQCYNYVRPFPTLAMSNVGDKSAVIINAIDIYMGQDGILWVLDNGIINTLEDIPTKESDPKVLGINYGNGRILYTIPLKSLTCGVRSRLKYLVVEYVSDNSTIVYVGDGGTRSIIVWNVQGKEGYRAKLPRVTISCTETGSENVFYLVLIETPKCNYLYFTYLSSEDMFKVRTKDLQKRIRPKCIVNIGRKPCKMVVLGSAYGSVMYFRIKGLNNLYSWDTKDSFLEENMMLVKKSADCRTITHIDVDNDGVLWEIESNIEDFVANTVGCYGASVVLQPIFEKSVPIQPC